MTETPPTTDQQRASEIRRLFHELIAAVNAAGMAGLDVQLETRPVKMVQGLLGRQFVAYEGGVAVRREVI